MAKRKRNYKKEYAQYHSKPDKVKDRARRNAARKKAADSGKVKKGDGKHVHHVTHNTKSDKVSVVPAAYNLSNTRCNAACRKKKAAGGRKSKPPKK